jgi:hypothetical protein
MQTYATSDDHRAMLVRLITVSDTATAGTARHSEPTRRKTDELLRLRKTVAVALLPSLALWALIWFALTCLITNWP